MCWTGTDANNYFGKNKVMKNLPSQKVMEPGIVINNNGVHAEVMKKENQVG